MMRNVRFSVVCGLVCWGAMASAVPYHSSYSWTTNFNLSALPQGTPISINQARARQFNHSIAGFPFAFQHTNVAQNAGFDGNRRDIWDDTAYQLVNDPLGGAIPINDRQDVATNAGFTQGDAVATNAGVVNSDSNSNVMFNPWTNGTSTSLGGSLLNEAEVDAAGTPPAGWAGASFSHSRASIIAGPSLSQGSLAVNSIIDTLFPGNNIIGDNSPDWLRSQRFFFDAANGTGGRDRLLAMDFLMTEGDPTGSIFTWTSGVVTMKMSGGLFRISNTGNTTNPGTILLQVENGQVVQSVASGFYSGVTLPGVGSTGTLMFNLTGAQANWNYSSTGAPIGFEMVQTGVTGFRARPVPEPMTMIALGLGVAALVRRRKSR